MRLYTWFPIGLLASLSLITLLCCPLTLGSQEAVSPPQNDAPLVIPSSTPTAYPIPLDAPQLTATAIFAAATATTNAEMVVITHAVATAAAQETNAAHTRNQLTATALVSGATGTAQALQFGTPTPTDTARG
jgi:hypothetical protein